MVNLKNLLVNLLVSLIFTAAFSALFTAISLYFLPQDFAELRTAAEVQLPARIMANPAISRMMEEQLPWGNLSDAEFAQTITLYGTQCTRGSGEPFADLICQEIQEGRLHTKEDMRQLVKTKLLGPQLRAAFRQVFGEMEKLVTEGVELRVPLLFIFAVTFALGTLVTAVQSGLLAGHWNRRQFIHDIANSVWGYAFSSFLTLLLLWVLLPYATDALLGFVQGIAIGQVSAGAGNASASGLIHEMVQLIGTFMIDMMRQTLIKPMAVAAGIAAVSWIIRRIAREPKTRNPDSERDQRPANTKSPRRT